MIPSSALASKGQQGVYFRTHCYCSTCKHQQSRLGDNIFAAFCPPCWISDLLPVICIVFQQPMKTAPRTDLSRVARFVKPCAVRNEDSRYEIGGIHPRPQCYSFRMSLTSSPGRTKKFEFFHWLTENGCAAEMKITKLYASHFYFRPGWRLARYTNGDHS